MKRFLFLPALAAVALFGSCEKQTEAERTAEINRQVEERLDADRKAQEQQQLAARVAELEAAAKANPAQVQTTVATQNAMPQEDEEPGGQAGRRPAGASRGRDSGDGGTASYTTFYDKLEPHGEWRETSDYGYVWQPRQAQSRSWRPYTEGRWVYSDAGWTWMSEEPFGWATYHYGRWTRLRNIGWVWVPGDEWAPAWVSWRKGNDHVGWAPLPPEARFERGKGIHNWADNYYDIGPEQYSFVATNQFGDRQVGRAVIPTERNITIVNQTTNVTNITYSNTTIVNNGPSYDEIRARTPQPIERFRLERQSGVQADDTRFVVRGQVLQVHAPVIARAQAVERPRRVKERVTQVVVDRGWEGFSDRQAVDKVRVKMKSESTPPPNAPSRTFVKPVEAGAAPAASAPAATAPAATTAPSATAAPAQPTATPQTRPLAPSPAATATPAPTVTATPAPISTPRSTPSAQASPTVTSTPFVRPSRPAALVTPSGSPPAVDDNDPNAKSRREMRELRKARAKEMPPRREIPPPRGKVPMEPATPNATPASDALSSTPGVSAAAPSATAPSAGAIPSPAATAAPVAAPEGEQTGKLRRRDQREAASEADSSGDASKGEERRKGRGRGDAEKASPSPTATP